MLISSIPDLEYPGISMGFLLPPGVGDGEEDEGDDDDEDGENDELVGDDDNDDVFSSSVLDFLLD